MHMEACQNGYWSGLENRGQPRGCVGSSPTASAHGRMTELVNVSVC